MVGFLNSRLSIAARLWLMVTVSTVPDILLTGLFIKQSLIEISFAQKENAGAVYLEGLWRAFLNVAETDAITVANPTNAADDAKFDTAAASKAYGEAATVTAKLEAGKALMGAVADGSNLTLDPDLDSFYAMDAATVRLPGIVTAADALLKAAAEPRDTAARLVHIAFAVNRLEISSNDAEASLGSAMKNNAPGLTERALRGPATKLKAAADALASRGYALLNGGPTEGLAAAEATLVRQVDLTWDVTHSELLRLLDVRVWGFYRKLGISLAIAAVSLLVAAWLSRTISFGLSRRVLRLVSVMDRLVAEDTSLEIPYQGDTNETGRIAKTLVAFRDSVVERNALKSAQAQAQERAMVVDAVAGALGLLARGDLTATLTTTFPPEFETIRVDFNAAVATLHQTMRTIAHSAQAIRSGTTDIAAATADLAKRTDHQSNVLQMSTGALEQLSATIETASDGAISAHRTVAAAKIEAERSEGVVREAVAAMSGIEQSSRRIGEIIGVIDEIAAQTNLLSLNAAIEAARAGASGRGFAVVAAEVRELASHSADAAKQIRVLIAESACQVDHGATLVTETGKALERIVAHVGGTNDVISGIAGVADVQAEKLHQTHAAFATMDEVTQRNIGMVEQVTGAARSLSRETERLATLVGGFKMSGSQADTRRQVA